MSEKQPHVVVVGGGFAGLEVARGLKRAPVQVTVIDRANHHLFQPLLYQVASAGLAAGEIAQPIRHILRRQSNVAVKLDHVIGVDPAERRVRLASKHEVTYDVLVIATGATHSYFGQPGWQKHAPGLKSIDDALELRDRVLVAFERAENALQPDEQRRLTTIAIVGGGPTGVELAGAFAELIRHSFGQEFRRFDPKTARIVLIEAGPRILGQFPDSLATYASTALQGLGVELLVSTKVQAIRHEVIEYEGGRIEAGTIVWAAGVQASPAARWLGTACDRMGRVQVTDRLAVPHLEGVYALGDTAMFVGADGKPLPGLAQVAQQQGRYLGKLLKSKFTTSSNPGAFRYKSRGDMATIGRNAAIARFDSVQIRGFAAWLLWCVVHVIMLTGLENRLLVILRWAWAYLTFQRGVRIISTRRIEPSGDSQTGQAARNIEQERR